MAFNFRNNSANRLTLKVSLLPKQYSNLTCDKRCTKPSQSCSCVHENVNVKNMHMDLTIDGMPSQNWSCFQVIFYFEPHASCKAVLKTAGLEMGRTQRGILVDRLAEINAMPLNEFNPLSPTFWLSGKQMHCDAGRVTCILAAFRPHNIFLLSSLNPPCLLPSYFLLQINLRHMTSQTNITCQFGRVKGRTFFEANLSVLKAEKNRFCKIFVEF